MDTNDEPPWRCALCTYQNNSSNVHCAMCGLSRNNGSNNTTATIKQSYHHHHYNDKLENDTYQQHMLMSKHFNKTEASIQDFQFAASDVACYNSNPFNVFSTLRSVAKKLLKDDVRYRTLGTTSAKVRYRLIGCEGVLDFLTLLGFESDAMGMKLVCPDKPSHKIACDAICVLNQYQQQFSFKAPRSFRLEFENIDDVNIDDNDSSLVQIISWSTHPNMQNGINIEHLLMTHKMFTNSVTLLQLLQNRFFISIPDDILNNQNEIEKESQIKQYQVNVQKRIHLKVLKVWRDWMKNYWEEDFDGNHELQSQAQQWLKQLSVYNVFNENNKNCVWIPKLYKFINNEYLSKIKNGGNTKSDHIDDIDIDGLINYDIFEQNINDISDQITLIHYNLFCKIKPREYINNIIYGENISFNNDSLSYKIEYTHNPINCLNNGNLMKIVTNWYKHLPVDVIYLIIQSYKSKNEPLSPHLSIFAQQFNNFVKFIQIQILTEPTLTKRIKKTQKIIKMGERFQNSKDYYSLCAIFSVLNSAPIHRLKLVWKHLSKQYIQSFQQWSTMFDPQFNYRMLRQYLKRCNYSNYSNIPHIGAILHDLSMINSEQCCEFECEMGICQCIYSKSVRIAERICQFDSDRMSKYALNSDKSLQKRLLVELSKSNHIRNEELWSMSLEIVKKDKEEELNMIKQMISCK